MTSFVLIKMGNHPNLQYWLQYVDMVCILLLFTKAQSDGIWEFHLYVFKRMLLFFYQYDPTNYALWLSLYLKEMNQIPLEVFEEFHAAN